MRFRSFSVNLGADGRVIDTLACESSWAPSEGAQVRIQAVKQTRRNLGDLVLIRPDGSTNVLRATDSGTHVFLLDTDAGERPLLNAGPAWFAEATPGLFQKKQIASVRHLYLGHRTAEYERLLNQLRSEAARECYRFLDATPEFKPTVQDLDSRILFYRAGVLWSVPGTYGANAEAAAEDQKWLVERLSGG